MVFGFFPWKGTNKMILTQTTPVSSRLKGPCHYYPDMVVLHEIILQITIPMPLLRKFVQLFQWEKITFYFGYTNCSTRSHRISITWLGYLLISTCVYHTCKESQSCPLTIILLDKSETYKNMIM